MSGKPTVEWIGFVDDYGIIGWGFDCEKCGNYHKFADYWEDEVECDKCGYVHMSPGNPDE